MSQDSAGGAGGLAAGIYDANAPTLTDGQQRRLRLDSTGALVTTGGGSGGAEPTNITQVGGVAVPGSGATVALPVGNASGVFSATNPEPVTGATAPLSTSDDWFYAGATGGITGTSDVVLVAASANLYNTCSSLQFLNTSTTGTEIVIKDGSTIIWRGYAQPTVAAVTQPGMTAITFVPPLRSSLNSALNFACLTTSSATRISAQGSQVA